jgi:hypothetical protein
MWLWRVGDIALASSGFSALGARFSMQSSSKQRGEQMQAYSAVLNGACGSSTASGSGRFHSPPWFGVQLVHRSSGDPKASRGAAAPNRPRGGLQLSEKSVKDQVPWCARVAVVWIEIGGRRVTVL